MSAREPGWYDDGSGALRWWDGTGWGEVAPAPAAPVPAGGVVEEAPAAERRPPRRKKAWIVVGVAAVGVVVASAILLPQAMGTPAGGPEATRMPTPTESDRVAVPAGEVGETDDDLLHPEEWDITGPAVEPANAAERAAVQALELYESSWDTADCDAYMQSTTDRWRAALYIEDCDTFAQVSASLGDSEDELTTALIKSTGRNSFTIGVVNTIPLDEDETLPATPEGPAVWRTLASYHLWQTNGEWRVDEVHDLADGREEWEMSPGEQAESDLTLSQWEAAIIGGDCDALFASTTEHFREGGGLTDCAALQTSLQERGEYCEMSMERVDTYYQTKWDSHHDEIIATVAETCLYLEDADGNELDPPEEGDPVEVEFHLVYDWDAGRWLIDNVG